MLPIEWVHIVPVDQLQPGDFAFLLNDDSEKVLVGLLDDVVVAYLGDPKGSVASVQTFDGNALVIKDWQLEVDHTRTRRFDHLDRRIGSIVIQDGKLVLMCGTPQGRAGYLPLPIKDTEVSSGRVRYGFPDWRLFKMNGDEKVVLYERTPAEA